MSPFRNDLDAADARKEKLAAELEDADNDAAELRGKQAEAEKQRLEEEAALKGPPWYRLKRLVLFPIAVFGIFVGLPILGNLTASCHGYRAAALQAVEDCPRTKAALGDDIRFGYTGFACQTTCDDEEQSGMSKTGWRMPIQGSRSSGTYSFEAQNNGDGWFIRSGHLKLDGDYYSLDKCGYIEPPPTPLEMFHKDLEHLAERATENCDADDADACLTLAHVHQMDAVVDMDLVKEYMAKACLLGLRVACLELAALEQAQP